jgi:hypothetical protein
MRHVSRIADLLALTAAVSKSCQGWERCYCKEKSPAQGRALLLRKSY